MVAGFARSRGERTFGVAAIVVLMLLVCVAAYPLVYVLLASLSDPGELVANRGLLWRPLGLSLDAYRVVLENPMMAIGYRNTLLYVVGGTALNMFLTCLGAYGLSRRNVLFSRPILILILFTLF